MFESSVNSEGIETALFHCRYHVKFESSVNSEGIETTAGTSCYQREFESSVNSEGIETMNYPERVIGCLRAV